MLGAAKKPLKRQTIATLQTRQSTLESKVAAGTATKKQTARLNKVSGVLGKKVERRDAALLAAIKARGGDSAPGGADITLPPPPTTPPLTGYQWTYDSGTNQYVQTQVAPTNAPPADAFYGGGGGGGTAPDFSRFSSPSGEFDPAWGQTTPQPLKVDPEAEGMSTTTKIAIGAAALLGAALIFRRRRSA